MSRFTERLYAPNQITVKNLRHDKASKIIGSVSTSPFIEISCAIKDSLSGRTFATITRIPYQDVRGDNQIGLRSLMDSMTQGGGEVTSETTVRKIRKEH